MVRGHLHCAACLNSSRKTKWDPGSAQQVPVQSQARGSRLTAISTGAPSNWTTLLPSCRFASWPRSTVARIPQLPTAPGGMAGCDARCGVAASTTANTPLTLPSRITAPVRSPAVRRHRRWASPPNPGAAPEQACGCSCAPLRPQLLRAVAVLVVASRRMAVLVAPRQPIRRTRRLKPELRIEDACPLTFAAISSGHEPSLTTVANSAAARLQAVDIVVPRPGDMGLH
jgi:hypothetical protein